MGIGQDEAGNQSSPLEWSINCIHNAKSNSGQCSDPTLLVSPHAFTGTVCLRVIARRHFEFYTTESK